MSPDVLADHLATPVTDSKLFDAYVMNPRIENERLTPYKAFFTDRFTPRERNEFRNNPRKWVEWCRNNIATDTVWNLLAIRMNPEAVRGLADNRSRDIFFVAGARSFGIPARIDPVTGKTQYADSSDNWTDVKFNDERLVPATPKGDLKLNFTPVGRTVDPKYYSQFTISKIENGLPRVMEFDEDDTAGSIERKGERFDEGRYMLITGQRMANGGVLARADIFNIHPDQRTERPLTIRQNSTEVQVIGSFNSENLYHDLAEDTDKSLLSTTGRGYYILGLIRPNNEPTTHNLNDISAVASEFEARGNKMVLLFADRDEAARFDKGRFPSLPSNVVFGTDIDGKILGELVENLNLPDSERPIFIIADTFNRVVFLSQGYTIGLGETLTDILHRL